MFTAAFIFFVNYQTNFNWIKKLVQFHSTLLLYYIKRIIFIFKLKCPVCNLNLNCNLTKIYLQIVLSLILNKLSIFLHFEKTCLQLDFFFILFLFWHLYSVSTFRHKLFMIKYSHMLNSYWKSEFEIIINNFIF